jgi:hypothetical protein
MSSPYLTGNKNEILWALPVVCDLAKDVLSPEEFEEAEETAFKFIGNKTRKREAVLRIYHLVGSTPKRPLYYAQHELIYLPRWTRDGIRYLGDYIDLLVKAMAFEVTKDKSCLKSSLGVNVRRLSPGKYGIPSKLVDKLARYNSFLYQPGKHDFHVPQGQSHRFTCKEAILTVFITMKLGDEIKKLSPHATKVSLDQAELSEIQT